MTVGTMDLPPEGMLLGGVALAGDPARGTPTTEGLSLLFTTAGITVQSEQPKAERLLAWSGLDSASCWEQAQLPDGRSAAVLILTSGGHAVRFLLPTDAVSPGQAAYLDQALPAWLTRYGDTGAGPSAEAPTPPAPAPTAPPAPPAPPAPEGAAPSPEAPTSMNGVEGHEPVIDPATGAAVWSDPYGGEGGPPAAGTGGPPRKQSRRERKAEAAAAAAAAASAAAASSGFFGSGATAAVAAEPEAAPAAGPPAAGPPAAGPPGDRTPGGSEPTSGEEPPPSGTEPLPAPPGAPTPTPTNRRTLVLLIVLLLVVAAVGAYFLVRHNNNSTSVTTTPPGGGTTAQSADLALATGINLRQSDLPAGWVATAPVATVPPATATTALASCLGVSVGAVGGLFAGAAQLSQAVVTSPTFQSPADPGVRMSSKTTVLSSAAGAQQDAALFAKPNFITCFELFQAAVAGATTAGATAQVSAVTLTAPPGVQAFGYLTTVTLPNQGTRIIGDAYLIGGRIETTIQPTTTGAQVPSDAFGAAYQAVVGRVAAAAGK